MVSLGPVSVQPAERIAGKVDLAEFQWKERDPRGPRGGAVAGRELLATSKPGPPPSRSWFKNEKTTKRDDAMFVRRRNRKTTSQSTANVVSGEITTNARSAHTDPKVRRRWQARLRRQRLTDNNFSQTPYSAFLLYSCPSYNCSTHSPCLRSSEDAQPVLNLRTSMRTEFLHDQASIGGSSISSRATQEFLSGSPIPHGKTWIYC